MPQNTQHELTRSYAGRTLSHRHGSRAANADASGFCPATLEDELILEEQRREALKRLLTQPEYPSRKKLVVPFSKAPLASSLTSMSPRQASNLQPPINRLPNELLCAIFLNCGDPSPGFAFLHDWHMHTFLLSPYDAKLFSRTAVLLGHVCARWFMLTRGFPGLWTLVDVGYPNREATSVLKRCLLYSAGQPLTLWINAHGRPNGHKEVADLRFMPLVAANAQRWVEISISLCDDGTLLDPLMALPHGSFKILSRACINFFNLTVRNGEKTATQDTRLCNALHASPNLTTVGWKCTEFIRLGLASAPLRQLTSIALHDAEPTELSRVVYACANLEFLLVRINPCKDWMQRRTHTLGFHSPICLRRLRTLALVGSLDWMPLFEALIVPALDRLDLGNQEIPTHVIEGMLLRSRATLPRLCAKSKFYAIHCPIATEGFLPNTSTRLLRYTLKTSSYAPSIDQGERMISNVVGQDTLGGVSHAGLTPSPHGISPDARDAPADVGSTSSATRDLELALEARRREALKRVLTQPEHPTQKAGSKSAKALIHSDSSSMSHRQAHNSQLPINRLPNELLCAIFFVCGDPSPASVFPRDSSMHDLHINPLNLKSYSRNAILLGVVCSRWYRVTHGFPALWTLVDVEYPARYATNILKRCLAHSDGLPLTLWISESVNPWFGMNGEDPDPRFMDLVAANAHRWREISIELYDRRDAVQPLIALPPGAFRILSRARINFYSLNAEESSLDTQLWRSWLTSPTLSSVDWVNTEHIRSGLAVASLQRLTSIGMHFAEPAMLACILNTCLSLEVLLVEIEPHTLRMRSMPLTLNSISLPHLRTLMLCGPYNWTPLFNALTIPAIDRLELSRQNINGHDIEGMLQRSCARLRMLTIFWPGLNQADHILAIVRSASLRGLKVLRYQCSPHGGANQGWEDAFDIRPFVPAGVLYTADANEAECLYARLENSRN
ncbi:uncharacterized protein SCHCODRAFT_01136376 [Schizophyllum commune H4-8]|nr:uncharacterized protein SCHCODRAFT_02520726 [Schizophyllum commune H4-8]XP_050202556.1 uncharacterized protein SCHCODRAFT_01136376 [Schizophyllum commune H4-8]KAI5885463.1 hypothetical protein SCHCODRAFT_02520726 [Schizophyllum commune H4-8]KAI5898978.1 hypothetical protein SCHCODRAFT_01136376 [Schizophyllum commune H4-8]